MKRSLFESPLARFELLTGGNKPFQLVHTTQTTLARARARQHLRRLYAFYNSFPLFTCSYAFFKVRNGRKIGIRPELACWNYTSPSLWFSNLIAVCRHRRRRCCCHVFGRKWSRAKVAIKFLTREPSVYPQSNRNVLRTGTDIIYC